MKHSHVFLSADGHESGNALSLWKDRLSTVGLDGTLSTQEYGSFFVESRGYPFGPCKLYFIQTAPCRFERSRRDCALSPSDFFSLCYLRQGSLLIEQGDRRSHIQPGDCFLFYSAEPGIQQVLSSCHTTSLLFPRTLLQRWMPYPFDMTAVPLASLSPFGKTLASFLDTLTPDFLQTGELSPDFLIEQIFGLLSITLKKSKSLLSSYREALFYRLHESLRLRCCDPTFDQSALAREHNISPRTIQGIFASAGTNFSRELLSLRMKKARHLLDNALYDKKSIAEIAALLGYPTPNLFITHFRKAHGTPPASYRKRRHSSDGSETLAEKNEVPILFHGTEQPPFRAPSHPMEACLSGKRHR